MMLDPFSDVRGSAPQDRGPDGFGTHYSARRVKHEFDERGWIWGEYLSFTTIRNPWERIVSCYHYGLKNPQLTLGRAANAAKDFKHFVRMPRMDRIFFSKFNASAFVFGENGERLVSKVIKLETLAADISPLLRDIGLPEIPEAHINATEHGDYRGYYDDETRQLVASIFRKDIELGEYEFNPPAGVASPRTR